MKRYKVEVLEQADKDVMIAVSFLSNVSVDAAYKFLDDWDEKTQNLRTLPSRFPAYERIPLFHKIPMVFDYLAFYTIDEANNTVTIHRVFNAKMDIDGEL